MNIKFRMVDLDRATVIKKTIVVTDNALSYESKKKQDSKMKESPTKRIVRKIRLETFLFSQYA